MLGYLLGVLISNHKIEEIQNNEKLLNSFYNNNKYELIIKIESINKVDAFQIEYLSSLVKIGEETIDKKIKLIINSSKNNQFEKGYIIKTNTKLYEFVDFDNFSYKNYMLSKNIYFKSNLYDFEIINIEKINIIEQNIIKVRNLFLNTIYEIYPNEEAIFLGGILIGAREGLPKELKQDFNNSGLTHFIAVSGFNITILIIFITYLLQYFPISLRLIFITLTIACFTILVGDTAPVIRASIMGLIGYYIISSGRKGDILSIILLTAVIMSIFSPFSINYDISMHLSFLAVLGIIYTGKYFERIFFFLPNFLEIRTALTLTLSSLSFTLPIMILNFGQVSILAPFANIAVTWTIPLAMIFGFISVIVHIVYPIVGIWIGYLTWIFLKWDIIVVHFFGKQEWSLLKFDLGIYKYHLEIIYFIILIFLIIWFREKKEQA